jgi:hypothetical protein
MNSWRIDNAMPLRLFEGRPLDELEQKLFQLAGSSRQ